MSYKEGLIEGGEQSAYEDNRGDSTESLAISEESGLLGRLKRHVRKWPRQYVEMRVDARTSRKH